MAEEAQPVRKSSGAFQRLVLWLLIFALLGVVWWLASERNERHFRLTSQNGVLLVERGRFFPMGTARIDAADPALGKAYGPLQLPQGAKVSDAEYDDQSALDRALFDQLQPWVKTLAQKGDIAGAKALVDRVSLLPGLSPPQHAQLSGLEGELSWTTAQEELRQAGRLLLSARRKLEQVRDAAGEHALDAATISRQLAPVVDDLAAVAGGSLRPTEARTPDGGPAAQAARPEGGVPDGGARPGDASRPDGGSRGRFFGGADAGSAAPR